MIETLTPEQEALMPIIRDEWIRIGLDTTPIDKQVCEEAIALAYECAGLQVPQEILWFNNPFDATNYVNSVKAQEIAGEVIRDAINETVWKPVWYAVRDAVDQTLVKTIGKVVREPVWTNVWTSVWILFLTNSLFKHQFCLKLSHC